MFFFFLLQMENYFLICWEIYTLSMPGKTSSLSLNLLLITWDGSILLVVWPGFLWINFLFRKVIWKMSRLHNEAAVSLWQASLWGEGEGCPKYDKEFALGARRCLVPSHGDDLPCLPGESHHKAKSSCESWRGKYDQSQGALHLVFGGVIPLPPCQCTFVMCTC